MRGRSVVAHLCVASSPSHPPDGMRRAQVGGEGATRLVSARDEQKESVSSDFLTDTMAGWEGPDQAATRTRN